MIGKGTDSNLNIISHFSNFDHQRLRRKKPAPAVRSLRGTGRLALRSVPLLSEERVCQPNNNERDEAHQDEPTAGNGLQFAVSDGDEFLRQVARRTLKPDMCSRFNGNRRTCFGDHNPLTFTASRKYRTLLQGERNRNGIPGIHNTTLMYFWQYSVFYKDFRRCSIFESFSFVAASFSFSEVTSSTGARSTKALFLSLPSMLPA